VAVRTLGERVLRQRVVRAASGGAFLGVSPFWIRHGKFLFFRYPIQAQLGWDFPIRCFGPARIVYIVKSSIYGFTFGVLCDPVIVPVSRASP